MAASNAVRLALTMKHDKFPGVQQIVSGQRLGKRSELATRAN